MGIQDYLKWAFKLRGHIRENSHLDQLIQICEDSMSWYTNISILKCNTHDKNQFL